LTPPPPSQQQQQQVLQPRDKRHGFHFNCQTCETKQKHGGYTNVKQFARSIQGIKKQHLNHDYKLEQSFHAAEIGHAQAEVAHTAHANRQVVTVTTMTDVTSATISSASFVTGKRYYIEVTALLDNSNLAGGAKVQALHGTTAWTDSLWDFEPNNVASTTAGRMPYNWWIVWTAVSGEGIKLQFASEIAGNTTGIDQINIVAMKLDDDLTKGTHWDVTETAANTTIPATANTDTSFNNAVVSITPPVANDIWLVKSKAAITNSLLTVSNGSRIVSTGTVTATTPFTLLEGEDATNDRYVFVVARTYQLGAVAQTFTEKSFCNGASSAGTRTMSGIFVLNLSKFKNFNHTYSETVTALNNATIFSINVASITFTPAQVGDVWSTGTLVWDPNAGVTAPNLSYRMRIDAADQPPNTTTKAYTSVGVHDAGDELAFAIQSMDSLTAASHTTTMDASAGASGGQVKGRCLVSVTMELAAAGGAALVQLVPETEAITENVVVSMKHLERKNETEAITEAVNIRMAHREIKNETEAITENVLVRVAMAPRLVNETETVTENVVLRLGKLTVVSETVSVGENVVIRMNRITPPVGETVAISEQIVVKVVMAPRIVNETEQITENIVYRMALAKVINETESILENVVAVVKLPAKITNETEAITENVIVKLGLSRVINETVTIPENVVVRINRVNPPINETVTIGENVLVKVNRVNPPINETLSIPEQVVIRVQNIRPPVAETLAITETVIARLGISRPPINETVTIPETVVVKVKTLQPISETESIGENIVIRMNRITPPINETVTISENVVVRADKFVPPVNETLAIGETIIAKLGVVNPVINEPVSIAENVVVKLQLGNQVVNESVNISEATLLRMDRIQPPLNEIINVPEDVIVRMNRIQLVGEQLSISENIIVKLTNQITEDVDEVVSISENVTIKVEEQEVFPAIPGGGRRLKPIRIKQKRRIWPQMSFKTYDPTKYVTQDTRYRPPTLAEQLLGPKTKVRRAFVGVYEILPLSPIQQSMIEQQKSLEELSQSLNDTQSATSNPNLQTELEQLLQQRQISSKPAKIAKSFVAKYDILTKINKPFTMQYEKSTLVSKTFIASYDIKVFDWAKLSKLQNVRTLLTAMAALDEMESIDDLDT